MTQKGSKRRTLRPFQGRLKPVHLFLVVRYATTGYTL
jgi:hypothetical protein